MGQYGMFELGFCIRVYIKWDCIELLSARTDERNSLVCFFF